MWTAADAARNAAFELASGESSREAFRSLLQLLDDYTRVKRREGLDKAATLFTDSPPRTGDAGIDAALAGLAEHLARHDGWIPPMWSFDPDREARPWWFVSGIRSWHAIALVESPRAFRKRGVFLTASALDRV